MRKPKKAKRLPWWMFHEPEWHEYKPEQTGLPVSIWIDICGWKHKRSLHYIRFEWWKGGGFWDSMPMVISKKPYVPKSKPNYIVLDEIEPQLKEFVIKNRDLLIKVGLGDIGFSGFEEKLKESFKRN